MLMNNIDIIVIVGFYEMFRTSARAMTKRNNNITTNCLYEYQKRGNGLLRLLMFSLFCQNIVLMSSYRLCCYTLQGMDPPTVTLARLDPH
jgi:hypothetical protein